MKFKHSDLRLRVNGRLFDAIAMMQAKGDVRYYLNGVHVTPTDAGGVIIVATNGHHLAVIRDPEGYCAEPLILKTNTGLLQSARRSAASEIFLFDDTLLASASTVPGGVAQADVGSVIYCDVDSVYLGDPLIDGKFPDWRKIVPSPDALQPGLVGEFRINYLMAFERQAQRLNVPERGIQFFQNKDDPVTSTTVVRFHRMPEYLGLLMPLRADQMPVVPEWAQAEKSEAA